MRSVTYPVLSTKYIITCTRGMICEVWSWFINTAVLQCHSLPALLIDRATQQHSTHFFVRSGVGTPRVRVQNLGLFDERRKPHVLITYVDETHGSAD